MATVWWKFPRLDNFGTIDPQGNYWKPDSNIQLPGYYPVVSILPGKVTNVRITSWGQTVVTVKLDTPFNSLATHIFYEHMSSAAVKQNNRVSIGSLIGYNNPPNTVPLGVGFYSGDVYGDGTAWNVLQNDLKPGGRGLLNPVNFLNSARSNNVLDLFPSQQVPNGNGNTLPLVTNVHDILNNIPGFRRIIIALDSIEQFEGIELTGSGLDELSADNIQKILLFIGKNSVAFLIRAIIVFIGVVIIVGLIHNLLGSGIDFSDFLGQTE